MLRDLLAARQDLRPTTTVVTHRDGHRTVEHKSTVIDSLPPADILPPALQPERKRPAILVERMEMPAWKLPELKSIELQPLNLGCLKIVTWNVWFSPEDADARMEQLFNEALGQSPDVLCLQEVVQELAVSIRTSASLGKAYSISDNPIHSYGCLLLVRHSLHASFKEIPFPCSSMGRSLLIAEWTPPFATGAVAVATSHLESLNTSRTRAKQLRIA